MKYKVLEGSSRPWADIWTTMKVRHLGLQKVLNPWTDKCFLSLHQIRGV